jgi:hypothetical protein
MFDKPIIQEKTQSENDPKFMYQGSSMYPTFKPGQMMFVQRQALGLLPGDVIIYFDQNIKTYIVHRIVKIKDGLLITRGDNNPNLDALPIEPQEIIGKVVRVEDFGKDKKVWGGKPGLLKMNLLIVGKKIFAFIKDQLFPIYSWIRNTGWVKKVWHPEIKQIILKTQYDTVIKYTHKKRVVAVWGPAEKFQRLRHPYDLVIEPPASNRAIENPESNELTA